MGYSEVGGNGSVHWLIEHEGTDKGKYKSPKKGKHQGADPIANSEIGTTKGAPAGHLRVDVMYEYPADAQAALKSIQIQGSSLVLFIKSNTADEDKDGNVVPQIRVSW